eukprot:CAMPEP_0172530042 /NCGR_PEP_ID=MMETSP1067-20121228/3915_1 /TAXON_ID=265564 ORGANISM="Thalassiosira punctigera, Strain Tpunct2005C2" /NCGR_SAMPLE_ID=MMETSP1067 /ASSEMBLY_ACC=CAM_ASM_000444 /LENGTH=195 /DNA_ID=CAMNT_0013314185 /DNA_START=161 /DNA_END=748 /DNA_ORIENTATION=-
MIASSLLLAVLSTKYGTIEAADRALRGTTPCELRRWHHDIENAHAGPGCSNSWRVPDSWLLPANEARMFFESSAECCFQLFGDGECNVVSLCEETTWEQADEDDHCAGNPRWHFDLDTKNGCTNNPRFPDEWEGIDDYFFDTSEGCCENFDSPDGRCYAHDICMREKHGEIKLAVDESFIELPQNLTGKMKMFHQ